MPTATPPDQVEAVLAEAVARPTLGARQLVDHLTDRGVRLSPSGVQKLLVRHRLGRRAQRVAALAQLTLGSATSPPALEISSRWIPSTSASPEGIGPVWQLTAVDTATRYGIGRLVGILHGCLAHRQAYQEQLAWPAAEPAA
jgi:hypothetical protein